MKNVMNWSDNLSIGIDALDEQHKALIQRLNHVSAALASSIDTFLVNWLTKHIEGIDLKFGQFLKENNIAIPHEGDTPKTRRN